MTRMESDGAHHSMAWDARNRMAAVYQGDADTTNSAILDQYLYDADAYRVVRWPLSGDGKPVIAIRDAAGQTMTEFRAEPGTQRVSRVKEYVTGAGQILVERAISVGMVTHATQSPLSTGGNYSMSVTSGMGASSYAVDIRTASGSSRLVTGIHPDAQGQYTIAESDLFPGEANFLRIRKDTGEPESYSPPATIVYDPNVNAQSPNVIRALSASRQGNAIILRWSFAASSTKKTRLYFERADGQGVVPLTANGLAAGVTSLSILGTALAAPCGSFYATQFVTGQPETIPSSSAPLPNQVSDFGTGGGFGGGGTCQDPPPPPNPTPTLVYSDGFHHRDHLGSLRVVTDSAGWRVSGHDYYPFGAEMFGAGEGDDGGGSRRRFTGHERDEGTEWDYMLGRYAPGGIARMATPDPVGQVLPRFPQTWNRYAYVWNSPLTLIDPSGEVVRVAAGLQAAVDEGLRGSAEFRATFERLDGDASITVDLVLANIGDCGSARACQTPKRVVDGEQNPVGWWVTVRIPARGSGDSALVGHELEHGEELLDHDQTPAERYDSQPSDPDVTKTGQNRYETGRSQRAEATIRAELAATRRAERDAKREEQRLERQRRREEREQRRVKNATAR